MDDRRQQLYLVADTQGYQFQNNISIALEKLEEAISLDKRKVFGETIYIKININQTLKVIDASCVQYSQRKIKKNNMKLGVANL